MARDHHTNAVAHYAVSLMLYSVRHQAQIDYSEEADRWDGVDHSRDFPELPRHADCSSWWTWVQWASRRHVRGSAGVDVINGERWQAGFTGTMIEHGARHKSKSSAELFKPGRTACFYAATGSTPTHVAGFIGDFVSLGGERVNGEIVGKGVHVPDAVASNGRDKGPEIWSFDYRRMVQARAYAV